MKKPCDSTIIKMPDAMRAVQMNAAAPWARAAGSPIFMSAPPRCYLPATYDRFPVAFSQKMSTPIVWDFKTAQMV